MIIKGYGARNGVFEIWKHLCLCTLLCYGNIYI